MAEEARRELETQLQQTIETLVEISLLVHDTTGTQENKEGLIEQMDTLVKEFQRLKEIKCDKQIPIDVIDYIDQGRNPDVYTREFVELLLKQNQFIHGKMDIYTKFQHTLAKNVKETYPEMTEAVDDVLQRTNPA
ncbi:Mediator of RNA polymerase II transcription subunit 10 [Yarrowia sp. C11]|nr:Mediator of RNA polymerase II transcription subunit 10 [Yarrowia sp. C11]KAG5370489.1 Mediator of RNA polymerase II transcription subunit 10 [Yarrowia sp. E02]